MANERGKISPLHHSAAAFICSTIATTLVHPLDVIKTRLQAQGNTTIGRNLPRYNGFFHAFRTIFRTEGVRGLYSGLGPALLGNGVAWGAYFGLYRLFQPPGHTSSALDHMRASAMAGVLIAVLTNPIWVVKNRFQLQSRVSQLQNTGTAIPATAQNTLGAGGGGGGHANYRNTYDAFATIMRQEGLRGLYAGLSMSVVNSSHGVVQLVSFEQLRIYFIKLQGGDSDRLGVAGGFAAGAISKMLATVATYPIGTVRTRLQERPGAGLRYTGVWHAVSSMARNEGISSFYRGSLIATARVLPHSAIIFSLMEPILYTISGR